ncbi:hypothetical protein OEA41_001651 [Lepraria neglecta]|uniref:C2H2-type domain-containing protein n=1 Tax=Lepraria neglecta TaxID=209136 RepID=A0AAE0DM36_9LECA|nr:hypothetical protein OEA41_001651 [Lepraria neglecta]
MAKVYNGPRDFVLFPREESFFDTFDPQLGEHFNTMQYNPSAASNMQQARDFSGHASAFYESYPQVCASSSASSAYFGAHNVPFEAHKGSLGQSLQRHKPSGSPSPSASQTFDNPSSSLSSASGASAQSTASSADGSPYANPQHNLPYQEKWEPLGLGIGPEIVSGENFNFDSDLILDDGKFAHCVGEYPKNFLPSFLTSHSIASSMSSGSASQSVFPALSSLPLALDTKTVSRDVTIDSILKEANTTIQDPTRLVSPVSTASTMASPTALKHHSISPVETKNSFKSPVTPASAVSRFPPRGFSPHPSLIQHFDTPISHNTSTEPYPGVIHTFHHPPSQTFQPPSPAPSDTSSQDSHRPGSARFRSGTASPYRLTNSYQPYPQSSEARRLSIASSHSRNSMESPGSAYYGFDDDGKERTRCPHPDCGRPFKDLKAHMLTHQSERPEKCPIVNCAYHHKGFARKYDKNRHTLTHYKGNMVCGFCPGSGSASEKSFNRADVFKRHLTSVHGVEQTPPNSRKKSPNSANKKTSTQAVDATGKCSTCSATFKNAQEFYEHLDDCVLRVVQQEEPSEAINEQHLGGVVNDQAVRETMDRHMLPTETDVSQDATNFDDDDEDGNFDDFIDESSEDNQVWPVSSKSRSGKGEISSRKGNSS